MTAPSSEMASAMNRHSNAVMSVRELKQRLRTRQDDRDYPHNLRSRLAAFEQDKADAEEQLAKAVKNIAYYNERLDPVKNAAAIDELVTCLETAESELNAAHEALQKLTLEQKSKPTVEKLQAQLAKLSQEEVIALLQEALKGGNDAAAQG